MPRLQTVERELIRTQILQEIQDKLQSKDQLRLDNFGNAVSNYEKNRNNAILAFVKTSLPINIFRSESNRQFLNWKNLPH